MNDIKRFPLREHPNSVVFNEQLPLITATVSGWEEKNKTLVEAIREAGSRNVRGTNLVAHRTDWNMYLPGSSGAQLFGELCELACQFSKQHSPTEDFDPLVTSCWGAIYSKDDFAKPHDHWPSIWSFVYFLEVGQSPSPLVFPNAKRAIKPRNSMFCLFPGWVLHEVPPQQHASERVMVAGNINHKPRLN